MKDQYVGDIGDYSKYALWRFLTAKGFTLGVNWYLTPSDESANGKLTKYLLNDKLSYLDQGLFDLLKKALYPDGKTLYPENRNVAVIEKSGILQNTAFFSKMLDYANIADRRTYRKDWVDRSLKALEQPDIIFLDPDNGLEVKSIPVTKKNGNKYVSYEEAVGYFTQSRAAVIIYQHKDRFSNEKYIERFTHIHHFLPADTSAELLCVKAKQRDYLFIIHPKHYEKIKKTIDEMRENGWREYMTYRNINAEEAP